MIVKDFIGLGQKLRGFARYIVHHKTVDVTADELNDQVRDNGSGYLKKNGYSIGISSIRQMSCLPLKTERIDGNEVRHAQSQS